MRYAFLLAALLPASAVEPKHDLTGIYAVSGDTQGACVITNGQDGVYTLQYATSRPGEKGRAYSSMIGTGLRYDGVLAVSWVEGNGHGVTVYRVKGRDLRGHWATPGGMPVSEELKYLGPVPGDDDGG